MNSYPFIQGVHFTEQVERRFSVSFEKRVGFPVKETVFERVAKLLSKKGYRNDSEKVVLRIGNVRIAVIVAPNNGITSFEEITQYRFLHRNRSSKGKKRRGKSNSLRNKGKIN